MGTMGLTLEHVAEKVEAVERQRRRVTNARRQSGKQHHGEDYRREYKNLKQQLSELAEGIKKLQQQAKQLPQSADTILALRNKADATSYSSILSATDLSSKKEVDEAIRYFLARDLTQAHVEHGHEDVWTHPEWWLLDANPIFDYEPLKEILLKVSDVSALSRHGGPRGSVAQAADTIASKVELLKHFTEKFNPSNVARDEIALLLGEWGGSEEAQLLSTRLQDAGSLDENFARNLMSGLATIGGPVAVNALMKVAETAPKALASTALSSLEYLSSGGSAALTEVPEVRSLDTPELSVAYEKLAGRLSQLSRSQRVDEYIRYRAEELLRNTIRPALRHSD